MTVSRKLFTSLMMMVFLLLFTSCTGPDASEAPDVVADIGPVFAPDTTWPTLPADWEWGQVIGINADSGNHIWSSTLETGLLTEWDDEGNFVQSWDAGGPGR